MDQKTLGSEDGCKQDGKDGKKVLWPDGMAFYIHVRSGTEFFSGFQSHIGEYMDLSHPGQCKSSFIAIKGRELGPHDKNLSKMEWIPWPPDCHAGPVIPQSSAANAPEPVIESLVSAIYVFWREQPDSYSRGSAA